MFQEKFKGEFTLKSFSGGLFLQKDANPDEEVYFVRAKWNLKADLGELL